MLDSSATPCGGLIAFPLDVDDAERARLSACLDGHERGRAARFRMVEHANRFSVAHARLRLLLAQLLATAPQELTFAAGEHGKPALSGGHAAAGLEFNLSHSGGRGFVGWAWHRQIGVDIEVWRPMSDEAALVRRYFSVAEIAEYELLPHSRRTQAFFDCWTRKEAYVKAVGRGLGLPLDSFDVSLGAASDARLLRASAVADDGRRWSLAAPQMEPGVCAAVVLEGEFSIAAA